MQEKGICGAVSIVVIDIPDGVPTLDISDIQIKPVS